MVASISELEAFAIHEDPEEIFAIQFCGEKKWKLFDTWFTHLEVV